MKKISQFCTLTHTHTHKWYFLVIKPGFLKTLVLESLSCNRHFIAIEILENKRKRKYVWFKLSMKPSIQSVEIGKCRLRSTI